MLTRYTLEDSLNNIFFGYELGPYIQQRDDGNNINFAQHLALTFALISTRLKRRAGQSTNIVNSK
jgi:hypothetical protein